jgi:hypothetical protein
MFDINQDILATSTFDNLIVVSKGLLFVRSVVIGLRFQKTQSTLSEELMDFFTRLLLSVFYTTLFMTAIYWGLVCGDYFKPVTFNIFRIISGI